MKKLLTILLLATLMLFAGISVCGASSFSFEYTLNGDGTVCVTYCDDELGADDTLIIPSELDGCPVTSLGEGAFMHCEMGKVIIPDSVTSIGDWAFCYCKNLTSVTIPGSVQSIGEYAFEECSSLTSLTILDGVTSIGENAFAGCFGLTSVVIPGSVQSIGEYAFDSCTSMTSVTILDGVKSIGAYTFTGANDLTNIFIPASVTYIGTQAFYSSTLITVSETANRASYLIKTNPKTISVIPGSYAEQWAKDEEYAVNYVDTAPTLGTPQETQFSVALEKVESYLYIKANSRLMDNVYEINDSKVFDHKNIKQALYINASQSAALPSLFFINKLEYNDDGNAGHAAVLLIDENGNSLYFSVDGAKSEDDTRIKFGMRYMNTKETENFIITGMFTPLLCYTNLSKDSKDLILLSDEYAAERFEDEDYIYVPVSSKILGTYSADKLKKHLIDNSILENTENEIINNAIYTFLDTDYQYNNAISINVTKDEGERMYQKILSYARGVTYYNYYDFMFANCDWYALNILDISSYIDDELYDQILFPNKTFKKLLELTEVYPNVIKRVK